MLEFLGQVPLLQTLPSASLRKIAEVVEVKHYGWNSGVLDSYEYIVVLYFFIVILEELNVH